MLLPLDQAFILVGTPKGQKLIAYLRIRQPSAFCSYKTTVGIPNCKKKMELILHYFVASRLIVVILEHYLHDSVRLQMLLGYGKFWALLCLAQPFLTE